MTKENLEFIIEVFQGCHDQLYNFNTFSSFSQPLMIKDAIDILKKELNSRTESGALNAQP